MIEGRPDRLGLHYTDAAATGWTGMRCDERHTYWPWLRYTGRRSAITGSLQPTNERCAAFLPDGFGRTRGLIDDGEA